MNDKKWLERKYPESFKELNEYFDRQELRHFKKSTNKIGRLTKDIIQVQKYKKGSIIQFRNFGIMDEMYPATHCIVKCQIGFTESGYHSFNIHKSDFVEILK